MPLIPLTMILYTLHSSRHLLPQCPSYFLNKLYYLQENSFDINLELISYQDKEVEAEFKAPEVDNFLLPPVLGDHITDSTIMHRYLPKQADDKYGFLPVIR